jgi:hypothetical protein
MLYGTVLGIHACSLLVALLLSVFGELLLVLPRREPKLTCQDGAPRQ